MNGRLKEAESVVLILDFDALRRVRELARSTTPLDWETIDDKGLWLVLKQLGLGEGQLPTPADFRRFLGGYVRRRSRLRAPGHGSLDTPPRAA